MESAFAEVLIPSKGSLAGCKQNLKAAKQSPQKFNEQFSQTLW